tara:strand:- start:216 stop:1178 length:963 start_codon:yes stop_codon:yes gene_type:complete
MENVVEMPAGQSLEPVVVVVQHLYHAIGTVLGLMPLGDGLAVKGTSAILDYEYTLSNGKLQPGVVLKVVDLLGGLCRRMQALAYDTPAGVQSVNKASDIRVDQSGGRVEAKVGNVLRVRELATVLDKERREANRGSHSGIVRYLDMVDIAPPTRISRGNTAGHQKRAQGSVETLSEANGLMVGRGGSFHADTHGVPGDTDKLGDKDATMVGTDAAAISLVPRDVAEVVLEDSRRGGSALDRHNHHTAAKLVSEDEHMVIPVVVVPYIVEVHRHDLPRVVAITREVELPSGHTIHLGAGTRIALPHVVVNILLHRRPVVET